MNMYCTLSFPMHLLRLKYYLLYWIQGICIVQQMEYCTLILNIDLVITYLGVTDFDHLMEFVHLTFFLFCQYNKDIQTLCN